MRIIHALNLESIVGKGPEFKISALTCRLGPWSAITGIGVLQFRWFYWHERVILRKPFPKGNLGN